MSTKRTKGRAGPFTREYLEITDPQSGDLAAIVEVFNANAPQGRIVRLRPQAQRLDVGCDLLDAARALIDPCGTVAKTNMHRFDTLMAKVELMIERAQNESLDVYGLAGRTARQSAKLSKVASTRNESKRVKAAAINAKLIALDDQIAANHPKFSKVRRAVEIIKKDRHGELPLMTAESLAKRIRQARK